jgi:hypothetical protein
LRPTRPARTIELTDEDMLEVVTPDDETLGDETPDDDTLDAVPDEGSPEHKASENGEPNGSTARDHHIAAID